MRILKIALNAPALRYTGPVFAIQAAMYPDALVVQLARKFRGSVKYKEHPSAHPSTGLVWRAKMDRRRPSLVKLGKAAKVPNGTISKGETGFALVPATAGVMPR